ncbi:LOW QUALITY PROTEIN: protein rolling stone-like [Drosophila sulfurigaster albostrigata]|uniref:LOW QUALITY PROTEIN: protein rolling stone-like n=1 Tax=Drosophila sulfurigaster albostrigata TaxID=89887 RepID=UPI002D2185C5|nr:LOW QUALITY PROTEIN: protein rolling stone-like [Drosophila sulfurigaster albostrigata]
MPWLRQFSFYRRLSQLLWAALAALVQRRRRRVHPAGMRDPSSQCCCQPMLDEFQKTKFTLHHDEPGDFCRSQWQRGDRSIIWLLYRWLFAAFFAGGVLASCIQHFNEGTWFIYLTDWGFVLCFYACTYGAVVATIYFIRPSYFEPGSSALKIYWASHFTTTVLALMITLVFWTALYPSMAGGPIGLYNLWAHAFNSVCMLIDCFVIAFPTRLMHFIYPLVIGLTYGIFSLIYYFAGGTDYGGNHFIYFILDWERPGLAIGSVCGCIVLALIFCVMVFWIYRFRIWIYERCVQPPTEVMQNREAPEKVQRV